MRGAGQFQSLSQVVSDVEAALEALAFTDESTDATAYTLLDRLDQATHLGVLVSVPQSTETDQLRKDAWIRDDVAVELRVQLARTPGQRASRNAAYDHEERIRAGVCGSTSTLARYRPSWRRTVRTLSDDRSWLSLVQTFSLTRFERLQVA